MLAARQGTLSFCLKELDPDDSDRHQHHAEMDDVAAVSTPVTLGKKPQGQRQNFAMPALPRPGGAPELVERHQSNQCRQPVAKKSHRLPEPLQDQPGQHDPRTHQRLPNPTP